MSLAAYAYGHRLSLANRLLVLVGIVAVLASCPASARAQSTTAGRYFFSAFDVWWERQQARNPWLREIDNTDAKSWLVHGTLTEFAGYALSKVTPVSFRRGRQIMAAFYVTREVYGVAAEHNRKRLDPLMDALVPVAVAVGRIEVRFRW